MDAKNDTVSIGLSALELRLLVQSLGNCLDTCKERGRGAPCEDCDAAAELKRRLETSLAA